MDDAVTFSARMRALREELGLTQAQVARRARLSTQYVGQVERGQRDPSLSVAERISAALGTSLADLLAAPASGDARLHHAWRRIPPNHQECALRVLYALAEPQGAWLAADEEEPGR